MGWWLLLAVIAMLVGAFWSCDQKLPDFIRKAVLLFWAVGPLLGTLYAMTQLWDAWIGWPELLLFIGFYIGTGMGVTLGFHRMLTHQSFEANRFVKASFLILGCMANQGRPIDWAANHLKHHAFSDKAGDPHSPLDGLFHAHLGWIFRAPPADRSRYCRRLLADRMVTFIDQTSMLWVLLGFLVCYAVGGWSGFLWGGVVRVAFVSHATFAVNSICHAFGTRPFVTKDESRNNWWVALLSLGEGWHNNHHAFPGAAYHGMAWWQLDLTGSVIRLLARLHLVWNIKEPTADLVRRRRIGATSLIGD